MENSDKTKDVSKPRRMQANLAASQFPNYHDTEHDYTSPGCDTEPMCIPVAAQPETAPVPLLEFQTDRMSETEWSADTWMRLGDKRELLGYLPCDSEEEAVKECGRLQKLYAAATPRKGR